MVVVDCPWAGAFGDPTTGHCYRFFAQPKIWSDAHADCASIGAGWDLVAFTSQAERLFVISTLTQQGNTIDAWTGANDKATEGTFVWSNGEPFGYAEWEPGDPNNGGGIEGPDGQDCVELELGAGDSGLFSDDSCPNLQAYLCEGDPG